MDFDDLGAEAALDLQYQVSVALVDHLVAEHGAKRKVVDRLRLNDLHTQHQIAHQEA